MSDAPLNAKALREAELHGNFAPGDRPLQMAIRAYLAQLSARSGDVRVPEWRVGKWGDGSTPEGMAVIFCDEWETAVAWGELPEKLARAIVEAHNSALPPAGVKEPGEAVVWPTERVNIPDPSNPDARIVGFRIREGSEAFGEYGLSEPLAWLDRMCAAPVTPASLSASMERQGWKPIAAAPKDGTRILLAKIVGHPDHPTALWWATMGFWSDKWKNWNDGLEPSGLADPTHFMFLTAHGALPAAQIAPAGDGDPTPVDTDISRVYEESFETLAETTLAAAPASPSEVKP